MNDKPVNEYRCNPAGCKVKFSQQSPESRFRYFVVHDDKAGVPMVWLYRTKLISGQRISDMDEVVFGFPACDTDAVFQAFADYLKTMEAADE